MVDRWLFRFVFTFLVPSCFPLPFQVSICFPFVSSLLLPFSNVFANSLIGWLALRDQNHLAELLQRVSLSRTGRACADRARLSRQLSVGGSGTDTASLDVDGLQCQFNVAKKTHQQYRK